MAAAAIAFTAMAAATTNTNATASAITIIITNAIFSTAMAKINVAIITTVVRLLSITSSRFTFLRGTNIYGPRLRRQLPMPLTPAAAARTTTLLPRLLLLLLLRMSIRTRQRFSRARRLRRTPTLLRRLRRGYAVML